MNKTNKCAAEAAQAAASEIFLRTEGAAEPRSPMLERRTTDRRKQERRRESRHPGELSEHASQVCTGRERQTLRLLLQGMTNKQIAHTLGIVEDTVKKHLHHVYRKLGVRRRALLIVDRAAVMQPRRRSTTFVE